MAAKQNTKKDMWSQLYKDAKGILSMLRIKGRRMQAWGTEHFLKKYEMKNKW